MSDIEKRKELSDEENLEKNSVDQDKKDENPQLTEKGSSQSADQGSVTSEENRAEDSHGPARDSEKSPSKQDESPPPDESGKQDVEPEGDSHIPTGSEEDLPDNQNAKHNEGDQEAADQTAGEDRENEKELPIEPASDQEVEIRPGDLKTSITEIEEEEKQFAKPEENDQDAEKSQGLASSANGDKSVKEEDQASIEPQKQTPTDAEGILSEEEPSSAGDKQDEKLVSRDSSEEEHPPTQNDAAEDIQPLSEVSAEEEKGQADNSGKETGEGQEEASAEQQDGDDEEEEEEEDEIEEKDYSTLNKEELIHEMETVLKIDDMKKVERQIKKIKPFYDDLFEQEKKDSLHKFLEEGGSEIDFQYAGDALDLRFSSIYEKYKTRRNNYYANLDKEKEINLQKKHEVLEKLRSLVDGEENTTSIGALKEIQKEWREIGPIPNQYTKSLWATYNALIDRFYDNRSIYFELKELDRKKNLEGKLELCERAEDLARSENIKEAVKELNELHEEFKHIGPVPKEVQEEVWQRFKAASDTIYAKRKEFVGRLKKDLNENLKLKMDLVEEVGRYKDFDSDRISDWNEKTREILEIQKKWERIGGLPREHAKEVNKSFWSNFKSFFNNKNKFFKKLEGQRDENLKLKEELVKKAETLRESEEWDQTAETLKELQKEWKNIGPVPEKFRNDVYKRFKAACDTFFDRRRSHSKDLEGDYRENLKQKEKICDEIEDMVDKGKMDTEKFKNLQLEFDKIGYVPRNAIRRIQKKYDAAVNRFLESVDLSGAEKSELKFAAEINRLKSSPNSDQRIQRKESELRRMISKLENDISLWKNNLEFFAESKTADKLREEFSKKIEDASAQLEELKEELKVLNKID